MRKDTSRFAEGSPDANSLGPPSTRRARPPLPARLALQGTAVAETTGYDITLFAPDLHHLSNRGKLLCALLYYTQIYDARACEFLVDYSVPTPLVTRLQSNGITKMEYDAYVGYADCVMERSRRPYPGSDSDFQLRSGINVSLNNLCPMKTATAGDVLSLEVDHRDGRCCRSEGGSAVP
jgi:hypothetical protein